ncbi:MAG TPA: restriction endonuclease subunit S [Prolixibacteraceae bacterium]|nr:restriction endonuclease subunit S [Prolixibacteraceae bacterium]
MRKNIVKVELGKICNYSKGKKPKVLTKEYSEKTPFPYVNIKAFEHGVFDEYTDGDKCNLCEDGDLLMVWDGARAGFTGKAKKGAVGSTLMKIEAKEGIEKNYLFYFLLSLYKKLNTNPRGVGIPHVEPSLLWTSELIIRSIPEQRAIVQKIENLFALLDKGIADLKTAQEQLKIYRQAVLKKAFEGEFTNNVKENELPEGWKWVKLKEVCTKIQDGTHFSPKHQSTTRGGNTYPYITSKNIRNGFMDLSNITYVDEEFHNSIYNRCDPVFGDVLLTKDGVNTGNVTLNTFKEPISLLSSVCLIKPTESIVAKYIVYYIQSPNGFKNLTGDMTGTAIKRIILKKIKDTIVPLPKSLDEQHTIVREIESRLSVCDKVEENISESLEKAEALRQSILKNAFEGKLLSQEEITKCRQEADYEPASVLLERIRKENKHGK